MSSISLAKSPIEGEWMIVLNGKKAQIDNSIIIGAPSDNKAPIMGQFSIKKLNGEWLGHVEGGPVPVKINDNLIEIIIDSRDLAGFSFYR